MKCEYCQSKEINCIYEIHYENGRDGNLEPDIDGHLICNDCFSYLNTFCELEDALAAAKTQIQQLELEIASHESDGVAA